MSSNSKKQIVQIKNHSTLPDFLLTFVDSIIKSDQIGAMRFNLIHYSIDQLLIQKQQPCKASWIYLDPDDKNNIIITSFQQSIWGQAHPLISDTQMNENNQKTHANQEIYNSLKLQPNSILRQFIQDQYIQRACYDQMTSIDKIRLLCESNVYFEPEDLIIDLKRVISWNQIFRCRTPNSYMYLSRLYNSIIQLVNKKNFFKKFYDCKMADFNQLLNLDLTFKIKSQRWPFIPSNFRQYQQLDDYEPTPPDRTEIIRKRLRSKKVPVQCPAECPCITEEEEDKPFCKYSLLNGWQTQCPNRIKRLQCNHQDPQIMKKCKNAQIKKKQRKLCQSTCKTSRQKQLQDGKEFQIEQCIVWGIDLYTRNIIYYSLPEADLIFMDKEENSQQKNKFIEKTFLKAINALQRQGYSIEKACEYIIQNSSGYDNETDYRGYITLSFDRQFIYDQLQWSSTNKRGTWKSRIFTEKDKIYALCLLKNYDICPDKTAYRMHTKGKGARCIKKEGIKQGRFIVQYYGQLYQPWRWFEKEDFIKNLMKKKRVKDIIPEFYNIYLEKHKDQPDGYDIMIVDPIRKGNYSSRFSHSCDPNCGTIITVSDGKYHIGMYSFRDIQYGQQLTFDYCSMTQSSYQHLNSICLCGMSKCRKYYLELANAKTNPKLQRNILDKHNCFHFRNQLILKALQPLTKQDIKLCKQNSISERILQQSPPWVAKWISLVLNFIQEQCKMLKQHLIQKWKQDYPWQQSDSEEKRQERYELYSQTFRLDLYSVRFQNLFTTLDKIKYYIESIKDTNPPLNYLTKTQLVELMITNRTSILNEIQQILISEKFQKESFIIKDFQIQIKAIQSQDLKLFYFRLCCLIVSHSVLTHYKTKEEQPLITGKSKQFTYLVFADIVYFYAFTHTYFTPHDYKNAYSEPIFVCLQQILGGKNDGKCEKSATKYTSSFIWGQLVAWFKQTVASPQASLSQDRRGTLSFPTLQSTRSTTFPFDGHKRRTFHKALRDKPASTWPPAPPDCKLSFKNEHNCYGTIVFQNFLHRQIFKQLPQKTLIDSVLEQVNSPLEKKLELFKQVEFLIQKMECNSSHYNFIEKFETCLKQQIPQYIRQVQSEQKNRKIRKIKQNQ